MSGKHRPLVADTESQRGKVSAIVGGGILAISAIVAVVLVLSRNDTPTSTVATNSSPRLELGSPEVAIPSPMPTPSPALTPPRAATLAPAKAGVPQQFSAISVSVYNSSGERGLAARVAKRLSAEGWNVRAVSGVRYAVSEPTVYYDPSGKSAAMWMATHDETVRRAFPRPKEFLRTGGLIVVVRGGAN